MLFNRTFVLASRDQDTIGYGILCLNVQGKELGKIMASKPNEKAHGIV
jgi:hypothetical protein